MYNSVYIYIVLFTLSIKKPRHLASDLPLSFPSFLGVLDLATLPSTDLDGKNTGKTHRPTCEGFLFGDIFCVQHIY